jgi:hypothetical protein
VDEANPYPATIYEPWIYLAYQSQGSPADWTAFDRIVITFSAPPTADMNLQTTVTSDITWAAESDVATGTNSVTILFSDLFSAEPEFTGSNVVNCAFSFDPPIFESFAIGSIQLIETAAAPLPCISAVKNGNGITLTWPTNAAGFSLHHTTDITQSFCAVTNEPVVDGTNYSVTLPCVCPAEFFCLKSIR